MVNFCLVKKNNIYHEIYDMLDDEDISMFKVDDAFKVQYKLANLVKKHSCFQFHNSTKDSFIDDALQHLVNNDSEHYQGNTIYTFADSKNCYEIIYSENFGNNSDSDLNQFASISNIDTEPIFKDCILLKSSYNNGNYLMDDIDINDIVKITTCNFYHTGVVIDTNNILTNFEFTGENPLNFIGHTFKEFGKFDILGFTFLIYNESNNNKNDIASAFLNTDIYGRICITLLTPQHNKKFWNITSNDINNILNILKNPETIQLIHKEQDHESKNFNPFVSLDKYSK